MDILTIKVVRQIFERMKSVPKSEIVNARYRQKMEVYREYKLHIDFSIDLEQFAVDITTAAA